MCKYIKFVWQRWKKFKFAAFEFVVLVYYSDIIIIINNFTFL